MKAGKRRNADPGVTVHRYGGTIILEPAKPREEGGAVSVTPSPWSGWRVAVDALRRRTSARTRGEAALAMVRAGIAIEDAGEPTVGASRLLHRQLDLARGLVADPARIVLHGFFARLNMGSAAAFMDVLRELANRGVACYIVAADAREAELAAKAVRLVFGATALLGRGPSTLRLGFT